MLHAIKFVGYAWAPRGCWAYAVLVWDPKSTGSLGFCHKTGLDGMEQYSRKGRPPSPRGHWIWKSYCMLPPPDYPCVR